MATKRCSYTAALLKLVEYTLKDTAIGAQEGCLMYVRNLSVSDVADLRDRVTIQIRV